MSTFLEDALKDCVTLTPAQLKQVSKRVHEYAAKDRWARVRNFGPGVLALIAIPFWIRVRRSHPLPMYLAFEIAFAGMILWFIYWSLKRRIERHAFKAVRELGFADICPRCGYNFSGLPATQTKCPECGTMREPMNQESTEKIS